MVSCESLECGIIGDPIHDDPRVRRQVQLERYLVAEAARKAQRRAVRPRAMEANRNPGRKPGEFA